MTRSRKHGAGALAFGALVVLTMIGCEGRPAPPPLPKSTTGPSLPPPHYRVLFEGGMTDAKRHSLLTALPYKTITLSRSECMGACPVYDLTLHSDGRAELNGVKGLEKIGRFEGMVDLFSYGKLCYLMDRLHFTEFRPKYDAVWPDAATVTITASTGDEEITVSDYSEVGPIELWAIQQAIDNIGHAIRWQPVAATKQPAEK